MRLVNFNSNVSRQFERELPIFLRKSSFESVVSKEKETENQIISSIYAVCFLTETGGFFCCQKFFENFSEKQQFWVSKMKPFVQ